MSKPMDLVWLAAACHEHEVRSGQRPSVIVMGHAALYSFDKAISEGNVIGELRPGFKIRRFLDILILDAGDHVSVDLVCLGGPDLASRLTT